MNIYENLVNLFGESQRNAIAIIEGDKAYVYANFRKDKKCYYSIISLQSNISLYNTDEYLLTDEKILQLTENLVDNK